MLTIKPITARVGTNFLLVGIVFTIVLVLVAILTVVGLLNLPDDYLFWKSDEGLAIAVIGVTVLLIVTVLPALSLWFSGKIVIDATGMRWRIWNEEGSIRWDVPFSIIRWQSVLSILTSDETLRNGYVSLPVIVYEISQGDTTLTLYRGASWDEVKHLPSGKLRGIMLFHNAKKITNLLDTLRH